MNEAPRAPSEPNLLSRLLTAFGYIMAVPLFFLAIRIVQEYERGVIFRLGRLVGARGPGLFFILPFVERMVKVDLRIVTMDVPRQDVITRDNVTVKVDAVVYFRVVNPEDAVTKVMDYFRATSLVAQTTLRSVLGETQLDELLANRDKINAILKQIIAEGIRAGAVIPRRRGPGASMVVVIAVATRCGTEGSMPAPRARDKPSIVLRSTVLARGGVGRAGPGALGAPP